jgi:hypothetical protein
VIFIKSVQNESKVQNQGVSQQRLHVLTAGVYRDLQELAGQHGNMVITSMKNNQLSEIPSLAPLVSISPQRIENELFNRAYPITNGQLCKWNIYHFRYKSLQEAVVLSKEGKGSSKAFLKFGLFCDNALKKRAESSSKVFFPPPCRFFFFFSFFFFSFLFFIIISPFPFLFHSFSIF